MHHVIKDYATPKGDPICLHENKFFRMMFNGYFHYLDPVRYPHGAVVVPRFANGDLLLVRLQRAPLHGMSTEFPRGGIETAEAVPVGACRELKEETGYDVSAEHAVFVGKLAPDTATLNSSMSVYLVHVPDTTVPSDFDTTEVSQVLRLSESEFRARVRRGELPDGMTLAAWTLVQEHLSNIAR